MTCNYCGRPNPPNAASCQHCGSPYMSNMSGGTSSSDAPGMIAPDQQPELPAWLESLRSGERPGLSSTAAPGTGAANFIADDLIDEDMLPGWMRPKRREMSDSAPLASHPSRRPASTSAPNTDNAFTPGRGMDASSLIDQQSLPSWLQEKQADPQEQENLAAASLVKPESLPAWIKNIQSQAPAPSNANVQPTIPSQGMMGNELIDGQELPQRMSAQDTPSVALPQAGLSTSSLLNADSLPAWLRQANQAAPDSNAQAFPLPAQAPQAPGLQRLEGEEGSAKANIPAASFIEMDSLPGWLRTGDDQHQQSVPFGPQAGQRQGYANPPGQAAYAAPVRPENVRVPSRPRGEMPAHEESAVAANVFASMLGVASAAPHFPEQQTRDVSERLQGPTWSSANVQQNVAQPAPLQAHNAAGLPKAGVSAGQEAQAYTSGPPIYMGSSAQAPGGSSVGNAPAAVPLQQAGQDMQAPQAGDNGRGQTRPQAKSAKRGFLSTILDWFSR